MLERDLFYDESFRNDIVESNTRWQASNSQRVPVERRTIADVCDGTEWEEHEFLGASDYNGETRLAFQGYADDVDIPNPVGAASGHHKMTFIFTSCINRNPLERTRLGHISLATIVLSKDLKKFTPTVVISGAVDEPTNSSSLGASLRRLEAGVPLQMPGHVDPVTMRGWLYSFVGDQPAIAELVGTKIGVSEAKNPCNLCENANRPLIYKPTRFVGCQCEDDRHHDAGCCCVFALRTKVCLLFSPSPTKWHLTDVDNPHTKLTIGGYCV